eukprot:TRINITY_DN26803_c0_g4_i1.p1 TRINITY_DN26803_c0_g4~~TRINITY_DN26803_c0_g4_i1.p1  ORF type:complete len:966 (+),score=81.75 TRINITY_DN26803_c0_g4_i1:48-2945(+)
MPRGAGGVGAAAAAGVPYIQRSRPCSEANSPFEIPLFQLHRSLTNTVNEPHSEESSSFSAAPRFQESLATVQVLISNLAKVMSSLAHQHELEVSEALHRNRGFAREDCYSDSSEMTGRHDEANEMASPPLSPRSRKKRRPKINCNGNEFKNSVNLDDATSVFSDEPAPPHVGSDVREPPPCSLLESCTQGTDDEVKQLLERQADPNEIFTNFNCIGKDFLSGTPLVASVLRGKVRLIKTLVEHGANVEGTYAFVAGAEQIVWSGTALHAAVPGGNLEIVKELIHYHADIHSRGSNGATLLWQASYFGQLEIADFLLDRRSDLEFKAQSQDDCALSFSPLHSASVAGHASVVSLLLKHKANMRVDSGNNTQPLDDAVLQGHADVVQALVSHGADIYRRVNPKLRMAMLGAEEQPEPSSPTLAMRRRSVTSEFLNVCVGEQTRKQKRRSHFGVRGGLELRVLDIVFSSENPVLMAAVALGMKRSTMLLDKLPSADLIRFLRAPGDAPLHIMTAIFRTYPIMFWQSSRSNKLRRVLLRASFVDFSRGMNIAQGPHRDEVLRLFNTKQLLSNDIDKFVATVAPKKLEGKRCMFVPVSFMMCHVANVHKNLQVLVALANCEQKDIFNEPGVQAILNFAWETERNSAKCSMGMHFAEVINLVLINFILNENERLPSSELAVVLLGVANALALFVLLVVIFYKMMEIVGHMSQGLRTGSVRFWLFDGFVLSLTGVVVQQTYAHGLTAKAYPAYNICLGVLVFIKWMRLLMSLRLIESIGMRILPITTTMWSVGPFCAVLAVYLLGSANMYYALGIHSFTKCFLIVYRIVVLGDMDLYEMENVWGSNLEIVDDNGRTIIQQSVPVATEYYYVVRAMMLFVSFVMGLAMMNLFIAMLCLSYAAATESARKAFMRSRALAMIDHYAYRAGVRTLRRAFSRIVCRRPRIQPGAELRDNASEQSADSFLWLCIQKEH